MITPEVKNFVFAALQSGNENVRGEWLEINKHKKHTPEYKKIEKQGNIKVYNILMTKEKGKQVIEFENNKSESSLTFEEASAYAKGLGLDLKEEFETHKFIVVCLDYKNTTMTISKTKFDDSIEQIII